MSMINLYLSEAMRSIKETILSPTCFKNDPKLVFIILTLAWLGLYVLEHALYMTSLWFDFPYTRDDIIEYERWKTEESYMANNETESAYTELRTNPTWLIISAIFGIILVTIVSLIVVTCVQKEKIRCIDCMLIFQIIGIILLVISIILFIFNVETHIDFEDNTLPLSPLIRYLRVVVLAALMIVDVILLYKIHRNIVNRNKQDVLMQDVRNA
ncbi:hypothetical protein WR25_20725 [Diploscapter pachys]|uniref:Uncharacterized protein n=1 Tax=Diploscapter pachys TaxID=2018661 RepID=A0A2A2KNH2_9BILA|nr:hypothetical protein WR25_20725 [Diploscapter pachys]